MLILVINSIKVSHKYLNSLISMIDKEMTEFKGFTSIWLPQTYEYKGFRAIYKKRLKGLIHTIM